VGAGVGAAMAVVTVNVQVALGPAASPDTLVAVHVTAVVPRAKMLPDTRLHDTVGGHAEPASTALGLANVTAAPDAELAITPVMSAGHEMVMAGVLHPATACIQSNRAFTCIVSYQGPPYCDAFTSLNALTHSLTHSLQTQGHHQHTA
jgi:hypothetical protein